LTVTALLSRLRRDLSDARRSFGGPVTPRIPYSERTWLRLRAEAAFRSAPVQRARGALADAHARSRGRQDPEIPPRRLQAAVGEGDYRGVGEEFHRHFVELGGLEPQHDVLDVGSGSGRMALPLAGWLSGRYEGFDVSPEGIEWCRRTIAAHHPNFRFQVADLHSERYNPGGQVAAEQYRFPYEDAAFDFAFLTSVFTHLPHPAVDNYLHELARVLRPGGRVFATYFLVNDETERLMGGHGQFGVDLGTHLVVDERVPERAVAFREEVVRAMHERAGLPIEAVHPGSWCGRDRYVSLQDITVSVRR
jgi:SAM-dependent methyltransferase